jgi:hypothetical protein
MKRADFDRLKVGDVIKIRHHAKGRNDGRKGKIMLKEGEYVCLMPLDGEPLYMTADQYRNAEPRLSMVVLNVQSIDLI